LIPWPYERILPAFKLYYYRCSEKIQNRKWSEVSLRDPSKMKYPAAELRGIQFSKILSSPFLSSPREKGTVPSEAGGNLE